MEYSTQPKLTEEHLQTAENININSIFGNWIQQVEDLRTHFLTARPFPHIIIPNFLNNELANLIEHEFPLDITNKSQWHEYMNPIEVKYANDQLDTYPENIRRLFMAYANPEFIGIMRQLTGIFDLEYDEFMHGAGLHVHPRGGCLGIHLDYEKHPISGKQRRINIILYMNHEWDDNWNGHSELWSADVSNCVVKSPPIFNHALIFQTNDISWHGLPEPILCPENTYRKTIAYYYVSPFPDNEYFLSNNYDEKEKEKKIRLKAMFVPKPGEPIHEGLAELYKIRANRRITKDDLAKYYPEWTPNLN